MPASPVVDLRIEGADQLGVLSRRLKEVGDKELRRDLARGIQRAGKPMKAAGQHAARVSLPNRGGLNEWIAGAKFSVSTRSGKDPAIRLSVQKRGHDLAALNRGRLRHPLYGNRRHWYLQQIRAGWFGEAMTGLAPGVRRDLVDVMDDVARRLAAKT